MLFLNFFVIFLFQLSGLIPVGTPIGYFLASVIILLSGYLFWRILPTDKKNPVFEKSKLMDILSIITALILFFCGIFLIHDPVTVNASHVNASSLIIVSYLSLIVAGIMFINRMYNKKPISV